MTVLNSYMFFQKEKQYVLEWANLTPNLKETEADTSVDVKDQSSHSGNEAISGTNSLCLVVEGLLLLLRDTLLVLPDNMSSQVLNHVVQAETLLVMSNNSDARVRSAVVKVSNGRKATGNYRSASETYFTLPVSRKLHFLQLKCSVWTGFGCLPAEGDRGRIE